MAKEEEDDDFTFGDFSFASFPSNPINIPNLPPIITHQTPDEEDDEWGDFVRTPPLKKPDLDSETGSGKSGGSKSPLEKLKGPLPLSLFGDLEDDDTKSDDAVAKVTEIKVSPASSASSKKSGFNDIIADLYSFNNYTSTPNYNINSNNKNNNININSNSNDHNDEDDDDENNGGNGNGNKEIRGENGFSFDFYQRGSNLDSKDSILGRKSFDVVSSLDGVKDSHGNGEEEEKSNGSRKGPCSNVDENGVLGFDFSGWGLESRENSGSIKRSSTNVDGNSVRDLGFSWWGLETRENNGSINRSNTNVDENAVRGLDFSGWGLETRENNGSISRSNTIVDENLVRGLDFSGWGSESRENNGSIKRSSTNVDGNEIRGLDFSGWGLESREPSGSIKRSSTNVDENAVWGLVFSGSGLESREPNGSIKRSSTNVDENAVRGLDFSGWGVEFLGNNSMTSMAIENKQGQVGNDEFSYDSNRLVSSADASTSNTSDFGFDFGGWDLGSNGGSSGSGMLNTSADINGLTGAGVMGDKHGLIGAGGTVSNSNNTGLDENGKGGDIDDKEENEDDGWVFKGVLSENKGSHENDITFNSNYSSNGCSPNKGVSLASKNEDLDGSDNNGNNLDENKGREFQGIFSEENAGHTIGKVGPSTHEPSSTSTRSTGFINGSSNAVNLFAISDGLNNLFPTGGGVSTHSSNLARELNNTASPVNFTPDILFRNEPLEGQAQFSADITIEDAETDDDFGDFTDAFSETESKRETDSKVNAIFASGIGAMISPSLDQVNGGQHLDQNSQLDASVSSSDIGSSRVVDLFSMSNGSTDLFSMVNAINGPSLELQTDRETISSNAADISGVATHEGNHERDGLNPDSVPQSGEIEDEFGDFAAAFPEARQVMEEVLKASDPSQSDNKESAAFGNDPGTGSAAGNNIGALPLSLFGDEESEVDTSILKTYSHPVSQSSGQSPKSAMSINDLISNLYSQAGQNSPNKFVGVTDSGAGPTTEINSEPVLDDDDFSDDSWEFKDSFGVEGTSKERLKVAVCSIPSEVRVNDYVDFYSKLQDTLNSLIKCHLQNIKKDGNGGKVMAVDEEIQDELKEHVQEAAVTKDDGSEGQTTTDASLHDFIEALKDPKLQILEAEYDLSIKLSSAEKDLKSSLELKRHVKTMMNLLSLGSLENHLLYVNVWSKMISICAQELQAGGNIWKQSLKRNVKKELLTEIQGKEFIKALGEIYRVAMVLDISARLYKPWILECSAESRQIYALLDECRSVWSTSGLEEALLDIFNLESISDCNVLPTLVESIQCIHDLDVPAIKDHVFDWQESRCGLSLLTLDVIPGMKMVVWDGKTYFVKLANLWANMISCDPPRVPPLHVVVDEKAG